MSSEQNADTNDPDYEADRLGEINVSLEREDARDLTVQRIKGIIQEQFSFEIDLKEKEVLNINRRIHDTRRQLDRLRACILAGYYGYGKRWQSTDDGVHNGTTTQSTTRKTRTKEASLNEILKWKQSLPSNIKEEPIEKKPDDGSGAGTSHGMVDATMCGGDTTKLPVPSNFFDLSNSSEVSSSRFYIKQRVIVGNTSKYILPEHREKNDRSTHKWMVYVRGPKDNSGLERFIDKVWFLLHPSYQPNDLVEVCKPPFQVTRRGWGEFPVRVQLHFIENRNKRVDIIHHLRLDKTYTGLQTLGAETHVDVKLDRKNFDAQVGLGLEEVATETLKGGGQSTDSSDFQQPELPDFGQHLFNDHSYSARKPETDGETIEKYLTPPASQPGSRCSSPTKEMIYPTIEYTNEHALRSAIQRFPIIDCSTSKAHYCASSLGQYMQWTSGKRLAAEWQRCLAVRKYLDTNHHDVLFSNKDIMNYCRFHGYSPVGASFITEHVPLCKVCGEVATAEAQTCGRCNEDVTSSLSCSEKLLTSVETSTINAEGPETQEDHGVDEECEINVVNVPEKVSRDNSHSSRLLFLPITDDQQWVQQTAAFINIHLQGTNIDGVRAPVTSAMLHKACSLFVEDILRKANRFTWRNAISIPKSKCILPSHIKKAVDIIPHCDFLTNKYMGVVKPSEDDKDE